jgi:2-methylaconitate cis-trans-isomerase PrpF
VFFRAEDLPAEQEERQATILRVFGGQAKLLADGLGGENPVLRKVAIVSSGAPDAQGNASLGYVFGQVNHDLRCVEYSNECGNTAAGVPLFGSLFGWCPPPGSRGAIAVKLANTGKEMLAEWKDGHGLGGELRLSFVGPVRASAEDALVLGEPESVLQLGGSRRVRLSALTALNDYVFVDSGDLGIAGLGAADGLGPDEYEQLREISDFVRERLPEAVSLKLCLVAPAERSGALRARIVYPTEGRSHPSFAVTGATTLAVASCIEGTVVQRLSGRTTDANSITIHHASGQLPVSWDSREDGLPDRVHIDRTCRLIMRGFAY